MKMRITQRVGTLPASKSMTNSKPTYVTFDITDRCNLLCLTCDKWRSTDASREMSAAEWKIAIDKLKAWLNSFAVTFSGGEPFLRPDLLELVDYAFSLGIRSGIVSNGTLITEERARDILHSKVNWISFTLNGYHRKTHDHLRGVQGSYEKTMKSIALLNVTQRGFGLTISSVFSGTNYCEAVDLIKWVKDSGLDGITFQCINEIASFHPYSKVKESVSISNPNWKESSDLWFKEKERAIETLNDIIAMKKADFPVDNSYVQLEAIKRYINDPKSAQSITCLVGETNFSVDPYGDVRLCFNMLPIGNIKTADPENLWNSQLADETRKNIVACCQECRLLNCNFSY